MKRICFIFTLILVSAFVLDAQQPPYLSPDYNIRLPAKFRDDIRVLYRKTSKEEAETLKPSAGDAQRYADFLRQPNTGLTRLAADLGCTDNMKIVVAKPDCLKFTMPGAGSSYSFRIKDYRIQTLADLTFSNNGFQATGELLQGIFTRIGDVPLEKVDLQTKGLKFLVDFQPAADYEEARRAAEEMVKGVVKDGFLYRRGLNAIENTTYVLRSIAYNGEYKRTVNGVNYNELDFDKRKDIIVAFRIVSKDTDGGVTILWKKLLEKESPKIRQKKK